MIDSCCGVRSYDAVVHRPDRLGATLIGCRSAAEMEVMEVGRVARQRPLPISGAVMDLYGVAASAGRHKTYRPSKVVVISSKCVNVLVADCMALVTPALH